LITEASEFVTSEGQAASRLRIYPEGTLLVAMYGEGKTRGQVSELGIPATINQACAAIHAPKDQYLMPFIKIALKANYLKMRSLAEGGNQPNLNLSKIKQFRIGLPPKSEVFEIIDRVESLFTIADQLEAKLTGAHKIVDRLTPALLAKAFRGELVPQDPKDEPASVLLERIRAARQAEVGAGKPSRRGRRNAHVSLTKPTTLTNMLTRNDVTSNHLTAILKECGPLSAEALWSASQLEIDDFYDQLRDEEAQGLLLENCGDSPNSPRLLEPAA
jgi:type I restriction enzyme S subunit